MKKILLLIFLTPIVAQSQSLIGGKNIIKWNVSSLAFNNYNFSYERSIVKNVSFTISYRYMPKGSIPFQKEIQSVVNNAEINFDNFQVGNTAITPELRIYFSLSRMKGFYIAPFARFATFDITAPVVYTSNITTPPSNKEALMNGKITSTSAGIMLGYQFQILTKLVLDFQIVGGHYGKGKGDLFFAAPLNTYEQQTLRDNLNKIDPAPFTFTSTVNANGAQINTDGPWVGVRGLTLGLGFRF